TGMFGRMAAADDDPPGPAADPNRIAVPHPDVADGHRADDRGEAAPALGLFLRDPLFAPAGGALIGLGLRRRRVAHVGRQHPREQPFAAGHPQAYAEALAE